MKITGLPARTAVATTDIVAVVDAAGGTPATQKATIAQIRVAILPVALGGTDVSGTLPLTGIPPAVTNGFVLTTVGGAVAWAAASGGGGSSPTGTGLAKVLAGSFVAAASTLVDADVSALAAIAGTKVSPNFGAQAVVTTGSYSSGTTPATAGNVAIPSVGTIKSRNNANSANLTLLATDATDNLFVGFGAGYAERVGSIFIYSTTGTFIGTGAGTTYLTLNAGVTASAFPIIGDTANSSPYGQDGVGVQAMVDANQTAAASVYCYGTIKTTGALTLIRTLTLPTATDAGAYVKPVNNACTGPWSVTFACAVGTTVTVANGKSALLLVDSRGVTRLTPDT